MPGSTLKTRLPRVEDSGVSRIPVTLSPGCSLAPLCRSKMTREVVFVTSGGIKTQASRALDTGSCVPADDGVCSSALLPRTTSSPQTTSTQKNPLGILAGVAIPRVPSCPSPLEASQGIRWPTTHSTTAVNCEHASPGRGMWATRARRRIRLCGMFRGEGRA
jgi:hypothetical protein